MLNKCFLIPRVKQKLFNIINYFINFCLLYNCIIAKLSSSPSKTRPWLSQPYFQLIQFWIFRTPNPPPPPKKKGGRERKNIQSKMKIIKVVYSCPKWRENQLKIIWFFLHLSLQKVAENVGQILQISKLFQIAQTAILIHPKSCQSIDFNCI